MSIPDKKKSYARQGSVVWLLVVLTASVFVAETLVMLLLTTLPKMSYVVSMLLDSTLLSAFLFPAFYFLVFRPLLHNIEERKQYEEELRITAVAFDIKDPLLITDAEANIVRANRKFLSFTGYGAEELIGKNPRIFQSGDNNNFFYEAMWNQLLRTGSWSGATHIKSKFGNANLCWLNITAVKNDQDEITHYVGVYN